MHLTRAITHSSQILSSGVLPWWALCQCPNLMLLCQAWGHDRDTYINLLSSTKEEEREALCVGKPDRAYGAGTLPPSSLHLPSGLVHSCTAACVTCDTHEFCKIVSNTFGSRQFTLARGNSLCNPQLTSPPDFSASVIMMRFQNQVSGCG